MKTGILYDSTEPEARILYERIRAEAERASDEVAVIDAAEGKSAPCICCFKCWTKTPGYCVLPRDGGTAFPEKFWDANCVVIISRITWGGYSASVKSYLDRLIPILHPYFRKVNGEWLLSSSKSRRLSFLMDEVSEEGVRKVVGLGEQTQTAFGQSAQ